MTAIILKFFLKLELSACVCMLYISTREISSSLLIYDLQNS